MQAVVVKCESCGATLKIDDESNLFTCEYCGTSLKLHRSEAPKETGPSPNQPAPPDAPFSNLNAKVSNYYTEIIQGVKNNLKVVKKYTKPVIITACVLFLMMVALSIILSVVSAFSDNGIDYGGDDISNDIINEIPYEPKESAQLPSNPMAPVVYAGTGDNVVSGIQLPKGNYYAKLNHEGSRNFIVRFYYGDGQYDYTSLANEIGVYAGYRLLDDVLGVAVTDGTLDVRADGNWTITFYEISETAGRSIFGKGDSVTGVISGLSGRKIISLSHSGSSNFIVRIYTYGGGKFDYDSAVNNIGLYSGQISFSFNSNLKYFYTVWADGNWTISIN